MLRPSLRQRNDRAFWQVTAVAIALVTLWAISAYAPQLLERACEVLAAGGVLLWAVALFDRLPTWLGWTYES